MTNFQIRHDTLHTVINSIQQAITGRGYSLPSEFDEFGFWSHVAYGTTRSENIQLVKNDGIAFQIYRDCKGSYELNLYFWK